MAAVLCVGLATLDVVQTVIDFPAPGEKVQSVSVDLSPGGPAANAARAVAALGGSASLLTALGSDPLGSVVVSSLAPVDVHAVTGITPVSMVVVRESDGERIVVSHNAGSVLAGGDADALVSSADVVLVDGHHPALALAAATAAKRSGLTVVLDAGSWKPVLDHLLPLVDVAACSSSFELSEDDLHARGVPLVIRTHGSAPVTWSRPSGASGAVPVPSVDVKDTNGAGDVWHGAYALSLARGTSWIDAIEEAAAAAAVRVGSAVGDWVRELARWQDSRSGSTSS
ncbi:ribokinase [Lentzea sp. NBRC 105346]|uniref:PfkB family carbohydrate kinase n=1 Tax=Lentzea sp. NBRC 105346 TaxID=3032205 RepID=UPI0024A31A8A|nr:PfkB family carbohydrate kinase [Lentzea sp. NBRC 105346]GLZ33234.1 ribokinase [Lentzea sp. NBRC 105346]